MNKYLYLLFLLFGSYRASAQVSAADSIFTISHPPDQLPQFPGGTHALLMFFTKNFELPASINAPRAELAGKLHIEIIIHSDGQAVYSRLLTPKLPAMEEIIKELIAKMPRWIPGQKNGRAVPCYYVIPIGCLKID